MTVEQQILKIKETGFVFIEIPRTGSSSISHQLSQPQFMNLGIPYKKGSGILGVHSSCFQIQKNIGQQVYKNIFSFSFVRNPFERLVSYYKFINQYTLLNTKNESFNCFIKNNFINFRETGKCDFLQCYDYLYHNNICKCSFIGRFQNRQESINYINKKLNVNINSKYKIIDTKKDQYKNYYNYQTKSMISQMHNKDLEIFNYKF